VPTVAYRCSSCLDHTLTRSFDVSHISIKCPNCGEFARFVHEGVLEQYEAFEESPPEDLDWERLGRMEKFLVCEKIVRQGKTIEDFEVEVHADEESDDEPTSGDQPTPDEQSHDDESTPDE